jgi:hypothetical protein
MWARREWTPGAGSGRTTSRSEPTLQTLAFMKLQPSAFAMTTVMRLNPPCTFKGVAGLPSRGYISVGEESEGYTTTLRRSSHATVPRYVCTTNTEPTNVLRSDETNILIRSLLLNKTQQVRTPLSFPNEDVWVSGACLHTQQGVACTLSRVCRGTARPCFGMPPAAARAHWTRGRRWREARQRLGNPTRTLPPLTTAGKQTHALGVGRAHVH